MSGARLVVASRNPGKVRELRELLRGAPVEILGLDAHPRVPAVAEEGDTYLDNARAKARAAAHFTGLPALADDSGLEVDALGGAPGARSARFAGEAASDADNVSLLLERLRGVPAARRTACFRCVLVVARPDGTELTAEGICEGLIALAPRGANGFGYDPVFYYPPAGATFAEMRVADKDRVSHRAAACRRLVESLPSFLAFR
jgi:XTP/dITP diphosphohydrolase